MTEPSRRNDIDQVFVNVSFTKLPSTGTPNAIAPIPAEDGEDGEVDAGSSDSDIEDARDHLATFNILTSPLLPLPVSEEIDPQSSMENNVATDKEDLESEYDDESRSFDDIGKENEDEKEHLSDDDVLRDSFDADHNDQMVKLQVSVDIGNDFLPPMPQPRTRVDYDENKESGHEISSHLSSYGDTESTSSSQTMNTNHISDSFQFEDHHYEGGHDHEVLINMTPNKMAWMKGNKFLDDLDENKQEENV